MANQVSIKKFRNSLTEFRTHVSKHFGHRFVLNGHDPKCNPMSWMNGSPSRSKGIDADLVLIFEDRTKKTASKPGPYGDRPLYDSIGFSFNQSDDDPTKMDVSFSSKKDGEILSGEFYSEDLFRELIKDVNREFRTNGVPESRYDLMQALKVFWDNAEKGITPLNPKKSLSEVLGDNEEKIPALFAKIQRLTKETSPKYLKLNKLKTQVNVDIDNSDEAKEIKALEKQIKKLRSDMKKKKQVMMDESGATALEEEIASNDRQIKESKVEIRRTSDALMRKTPKSGPVRNELEQWLSKHF